LNATESHVREREISVYLALDINPLALVLDVEASRELVDVPEEEENKLVTSLLSM
jgi:hypothetical protein